MCTSTLTYPDLWNPDVQAYIYMYMCAMCSFPTTRYPNLWNPNVSAQLTVWTFRCCLAERIGKVDRNCSPRVYYFPPIKAAIVFCVARNWNCIPSSQCKHSSKNLRSSLMQELFPAPGIPSKQSRTGSSSYSRQRGSFRISCSLRQRSTTLCKKAMCSTVGGSGSFFQLLQPIWYTTFFPCGVCPALENLWVELLLFLRCTLCGSGLWRNRWQRHGFHVHGCLGPRRGTSGPQTRSHLQSVGDLFRSLDFFHVLVVWSVLFFVFLLWRDHFFRGCHVV